MCLSYIEKRSSISRADNTNPQSDLVTVGSVGWCTHGDEDDDVRSIESLDEPEEVGATLAKGAC